MGTLLALAQGCDAPRVVCCLDARMQEVYHAAYRREADEWLVVSAPGLYRPDEVPIPEGADWTGCGSGFDVYEQALRLRHGEGLGAVRPALIPSARDIAALADGMVRDGHVVAAERAVPVYLRDKVALRTDER